MNARAMPVGHGVVERVGAPPLLEVVSVAKSFGAFRALDGVSLRVEPGSVHAILGENGAGKSTLVKCIMGYHRPDEGIIRIGERQIVPRNPREAQALGIGMVYQHFTLVSNMTVCENLVVSRAKLPLFLDWRAETEAIASFVRRMPFKIDLHATVHSLSAGEKQKIEILKQLYLESRVIILDEPTSVLTPAEADEVLGILRDMARAGEISVVLITHKFREVTNCADEVTVLRRGRVVGHGRVGQLTTDALAEMMMGSASRTESVADASVSVGESRLRIVGLDADDDKGLPALRNVSFEVRAGEIVGVAAIAGNGQEELVQVLAGQRPRRAGQVMVSGRVFVPTRRVLRERKVRCLPEEPRRNACVAGMSVAENMAFRAFDQAPYKAMYWFVSHGAVKTAARKMVADYGIRAPSIGSPIGQLSGGNVQRTVLARELDGQVDVLIAANPCMGLDFAAVSEIHARIRRAREASAAVLLVSADLDELFALADRILVMSDGRIVHETPTKTAESSVLGRYMAGHAH